MKPSRVILLSVVLSVGASVVTSLLLPRHEDRPPRTASVGQASPPAPHLPPTATATPPTDPSLEERVRRLEARLDAGGIAPAGRSTKEALDTLLAITEGERQVAIADSFKELVALGDDVVPEVVALLKSGRDQDWGGAFSLSGNMVRGYPRLRTLLIDVLRQIGTPAALNGLLDGLHGTEDATDFRDLFMLFRTTANETMVNGISAMTPTAVRLLRDVDEKQAFMLSYGVTGWIQQHEFPDKLDLVEELARQGASGKRMYRDSFALLVSLSPERAVALTQEVREKKGDDGFRTLVSGVGAFAKDVPRAQFVRYAEMLLAAGLEESLRSSLYSSLPSDPCGGIKDPQACDADARKLLDFLKRRLREETSDYMKTILTHRIDRLESALQ